MKVYIMDWADGAGNSHQTLVVAPNRNKANEMFEARYSNYLSEIGAWSCTNVPLGPARVSTLLHSSQIYLREEEDEK